MRIVTLLLMLACSLTAFTQKTLYSAKLRHAGSNGSCDYIVKYGPDLKVRTDDPCLKKPGWTLYDFHAPAREYWVRTEMGKLVYSISPAGDIVDGHQPVRELSDTTIMGYKCKKMSVVITEMSHVGFAKNKFEAEYIYYVTKELAYPHSYKGVATINFYVPTIDIDGVVLKGSYRIITTSKNKMVQKMNDDMARSWSLLDLGFDKADEAQFATPQ